jgi:hypothetical protein
MPKIVGPDWYEAYIEPELRPLVRLLRDNGVNTTCSGMTNGPHVECDFLPDGEFKRIHDLLFNAGLRNYEMEMWMKIVQGHSYRCLRIKTSELPEERNA